MLDFDEPCKLFMDPLGDQLVEFDRVVLLLPEVPEKAGRKSEPPEEEELRGAGFECSP